MKPTCPHCGKTVPPSALSGICPECLLRAGILSQDDSGRGTAVQPPGPDELAPLFLHLEILEYLGRGGMGAVYKARQPKLDRFVALKIIARDKEHDPKFAERFTREAQTLARLNHPNIVAVHDFGETAGLCFLIMEYVDGVNLRQLIVDRRMPPEQALAIVPRICEALQFAHEHGIVHRDIKPENILIDKTGHVKIADFGIAKILDAPADREHLTAERQIIGTPHYMAPEQVERPRSVDHRADIYSLGVVFYEMLTGELPLGKFQPPSRKVEVDVRLDEVVLQALEKEPERRYQRASEVKTAVENITAAPAAKPSSRTTPTATATPAKPSVWRRVAIASLLILLLPGALYLALHQENPPAQADAGEAIAADNDATQEPERLYVRILIDREGVYWNERLTDWEQLPSLLGRTGNRSHTVLEWALTSDQVTLQEQNAWQSRCLALGNQLGFEYVSFVGVHPRKASPGAEERNHENADPDGRAIQPVVIRTVPVSGARDVDPSLREIQVTFSQVMMDGSWSWSTWGEENFPRTTSEPRYLNDRRTCVLPVGLEPGRLYAIWLNSHKFQNFKDASGQPALPYLLIFETRK